MKKYLFPFLLLIILLSVFPFLDDTNNSPLTGLPWQIEILPDGSTKVFGIHIGKSRLSDAVNVLGNDMEIAIIAAPGEVGSLEMYYGHYRVGLLSGKMVLQARASDKDIQSWRDNAVKSEPMASGQARRYDLSSDDLLSAKAELVSGITFIPGVNLDDDVIRKRFGEPDKRIQKNGAVHYLYADKALDITLHEDAREVLQYVTPAEFDTYVALIEDE